MEKKVPKQCTVGQPAQCYKVLRSAPKGRIMLLRATSYKMLPSTEKCCTVRLSESGRSVADNGRASGAGSLGGGGELKMMMMICGDCQDARDAITLWSFFICVFDGMVVKFEPACEAQTWSGWESWVEWRLLILISATAESGIAKHFLILASSY